VPRPSVPPATAGASAAEKTTAPAPAAASAPAPTAAAAPPPKIGLLFHCPGCGNEIRRDSGACFFCGRPVLPSERPPTPPPAEKQADAKAPDAKATETAAPAAAAEVVMPGPALGPQPGRPASAAAVRPAPPSPPLVPPGSAPSPAPAAPPAAAPLAPPSQRPAASEGAGVPLLPPRERREQGVPDRLSRDIQLANLLALVWLGVVGLAGAGAIVGGILSRQLWGAVIGVGAAVLAAVLVTLQWFMIRVVTGAIQTHLWNARHGQEAAELGRSDRNAEELARLAAIETQTKHLAAIETHLAETGRRLAFLPFLKRLSEQLDEIAERLPGEKKSRDTNGG
jgi:hypothetical protein